VGEFHQQVAVNSTKSMMWALYQFITNGSQNVVNLVVDNTFTAVFIDPTETNTPIDGGGGQYATPTNEDAFSIGSFIVIEVAFANPGGRTWQAKLERVSSTTTLGYEGSPNGGFTIASVSSGLTDSFVGEPTTGMINWFTALPAGGDQFYLSSSDLDTYGAGAKYGYLRALFYDSSGLDVNWGFYVGGYVPFDETNDTDPFLMLGGRPQMSDTGTSGSAIYWGRIPTSSNLNRLPLENGQAVQSMVSNGYCCVSAIQAVTQDVCRLLGGVHGGRHLPLGLAAVVEHGEQPDRDQQLRDAVEPVGR
jgi:hypothetical protein